MIEKARAILNNTFGYREFNVCQEDIILSVMDMHDTLVVLPTGGGKSICYQIPALLFSGLTIVVSPLISLMKDQVDQLREIGLPAAMLNSSLDLEEYYVTKNSIRSGTLKLLYIAPETLVKNDIMEMLTSIKVDCIAIDEAHCISEWGHDFRPEYRKLAAVRKTFSSAVCIALTATATKKVREDIITNLELKNPAQFVASFNRENLFFQVELKEEPYQQLLEFLQRFKNTSGIIYCFSRNGVDALAARLAEYGYSVRPYHAGLSDEERKLNQELFIKDEVQIIVATIAFGMGIHKPNIRFVVHYDLPKSIESYYQEMGRAGRDGLEAHCLLLYRYSDVNKIHYFIDQKEKESERVIAKLHLNALVEYAEAMGCRRVPLLSHFGEKYMKESCTMCDNCVDPKQAETDLAIPAQMFLSCVKRVNERFGIAHIIDILRGSESQKIMTHSHHTLSTYGIGKEYSKGEWRNLTRQFLRGGLVIQDSDDFGTVKLTARGYQVMKGSESFFGTPPPKERNKIKVTQKKGNYDQELFEILRKKRKSIADENGVPPYIIFSDRTLIEMATYFPQHKSAMLSIHGIGSQKFEKYGDLFLGLISEYCKERNIKENLSNVTTVPKEARKYKYEIVGEAFNEGASIDEIMNEHTIKPNTIFNHLYDYFMSGHTLRSGGLDPYLTLGKDQERAVMDAFQRLGTERLKPIFDVLCGSIDYETITVYRLHYLCGFKV